MSLIARIEISNYLTEGLNASRRIVDWRPMINAVTLRLDSKSALLNLTNGGGKTSIADLTLYLLSRDSRLLSKIRDKCSPKDRGFTHARVEFRDTSDDTFVAPGLLDVDPLNMPGQTYVAGMVLYDKADELPIFYYYSGVLEDSPAFEIKDGVVTLVPDARFVERTKSLRGCQWNKYTTRAQWEDVISLHISTDVLRRNVKYQCEGSDDKNAQFFSFKPQGGETYAEAFFRAVVAPDLLTNILSTWAEEGEQSIEDTLYLSLSQIVKTDDEIQKKDNILKKREAQLNKLMPLIELGQKANEAQGAVRHALEGIRKNAALTDRYGSQNSRSVLPGIPKPPDSLVRDPNQDPRVMQALHGMFLGTDGTILLFADVLAVLAKVDTGRINQAAERKRIFPTAVSSQVIDFKCDSVNFRIGTKGGGVGRKGYSRDAVLKIPEIIKNQEGSATDGLEAALELAFDIAEAQLDTNPASAVLRGLDRESAKLRQRLGNTKIEAEKLEREEKLLRQQITSRAENRASWEEFQQHVSVLPELLRSQPRRAKEWLLKQLDSLREKSNDNLVRHTKLSNKWEVYIALLNQAGLEGGSAIHRQLGEWVERKNKLQQQGHYLGIKRKEIALQVQQTTKERELRQEQKFKLERELDELKRLQVGFERFLRIFGTLLPDEVDPELELRDARIAYEKHKQDLDRKRSDVAEKVALQSNAVRFREIFGDVDPRSYNPIELERKWNGVLATAEQSAARLLEKAEALDHFESKFPKQTPDQWLLHANAKREELFLGIQTLENKIAKAEREVDAINRLSVVDDGHYSAAWEALRNVGIPCERVADFVFREEYEFNPKQAAISAMSGLLPAPVFETHEALRQAAAHLASLDIAIPLLAADELKAALIGRKTLSQDVYMAGFIAGPYSRQARILLEPSYAQTESQRLIDEIKEYEGKIVYYKSESLSIHPDSKAYRLARTAKDAVTENVRELIETYKMRANEARCQVDVIKPQTTQTALAVLEATRNYFEFGGDQALSALKEQLDLLIDRLKTEFEPKLTEAERRATPENIVAHALAKDYLKRGGEIKHLALEAEFAKILEALNITLARSEELLEEQLALDIAVEMMSEQRRSFDEECGEDQIGQLSIAADMDSDEEGKAFMRAFDATTYKLTKAEDDIRETLQVNFERAQIYCDNIGASDAEIENQCTEIAAKRSELAEEAQLANERLIVIDRDERPGLAVSARAIHELVVELALLTISMRSVNETTRADFPDVSFPVEAHQYYKQMEELSDRLRSHEFDHKFLESITEMKGVLQAINAEDSTRGYQQAQRNMVETLNSFETAKSTYCNNAREQSSLDEAAMNALEIDEIEQSGFTKLQALVTLFDRFKFSIERDKNDAERTKAAAVAAHDAGIEALSRLIGNAKVNLSTLEKVMARYPKGRYFVQAEIVAEDRIMEILTDLKDHVARQFHSSSNGIVKRSEECSIKGGLKREIIDRVFLNPSVEFINAALWEGKRSQLDERLSTGQKVALQFMWIVRQAEFEIERRLFDMGHSKAKKERNAANRMIIIDGIFSSLSNRELIREAMSGLRDLGGNFQIIGLLHSETWVNDYEVFPVYLVGRKLQNLSSHKLISFSEEHKDGTMAVFSSYANRPVTNLSTDGSHEHGHSI